MELHFDRINDSPPKFSVRPEPRRKEVTRDVIIAIVVRGLKMFLFSVFGRNAVEEL